MVLRESEGEIPEPELTDWIASLPAPTGIFACNDIRGRQILQAAMLAGRRAPDEIAVLGVKEVAAAASLARVTLGRRFRKVLNRSLREEIERVRMEQVRVLLTETNYSLLEIASNTGYRSDAHLITAFHRRVTNLHIRVTPHASGRFQ